MSVQMHSLPGRERVPVRGMRGGMVGEGVGRQKDEMKRVFRKTNAECEFTVKQQADGKVQVRYV